MDTWPFWKMVARRAREETVSHAKNRVRLSLITGMIAAVLQFILHVRGLSDTSKIVISLIGAAVIVIGGSFVKDMVVIPAKLYALPKRRTKTEESKLQTVRLIVEKYGGAGVIPILRHLNVFESITSPLAHNSAGPADFALVKSLELEGLLTKQGNTWSNIPGIHHCR